MSKTIRFEYAVYMLPKHAKDPSAALREALKRDFTQLKLVDQLPEEPKETLVRERIEPNAPRKYAVPSVEMLSYSGHGLDAKQIQLLQRSQEAYILDFAHPSSSVWNALRSADQIIERIARETGGLVWDEQSREIFTPDAWHARRLEKWTSAVPDVSTHTVIHNYENGEFVRAISLGMSKVGLPDVVVQELDSSSESQVGNMINIFHKRWRRGPFPNDPGNSG